MIKDHYAGEAGLWSTLRSGLIPCKVLEVYQDQGIKHVRIELTGDGKPYKAGEVIETLPTHVFPRSHVKKSRYGYYLFANYAWQETPKENSDD